MKPNNKIFDYILITLAIFSISYFILLILNSRFITSYILYLIFACICILYSYYELNEYFTKKMTPFHSFDDVITLV